MMLRRVNLGPLCTPYVFLLHHSFRTFYTVKCVTLSLLPIKMLMHRKAIGFLLLRCGSQMDFFFWGGGA